MMETLLITLILFIISLQAGISLAAGMVVHPILMKISVPAALEVFKPFFDKTHISIISMSMVVTLLTLLLSILSGNWLWLAVSAFMNLVGPYTYFCMMPLNRRLLAEDIDPNAESTSRDILQWGNLHGVRTFFNLASLLAFILLAVAD